MTNDEAEVLAREARRFYPMRAGVCLPDSCVDYVNRLCDAIDSQAATIRVQAKRIEAAVLAEREACAKVVAPKSRLVGHALEIQTNLAAAIRARGAKP